MADLSDQRADPSLNKDHTATDILSYLYVSRRFATKVYSVLRPNYGSDYLRKIDRNLDSIKSNLINRGIDSHFDSKQMSERLKRLIEIIEQLEPKLVLKDKLTEKIRAKRRHNKTVSEDLIRNREQLVSEVRLLSQKLFDLERTVIKFVLDLPNDCGAAHVQVAQQQCHHQVLDRHQPSVKPKSFRRLNYNQLSYINKCYYRSIVGPKSYYLTSIGSQLNESLVDFFGRDLRQKQFIDVSGIDFVKTAVIEATNYNNLDDFKSDLLIISAKANQNHSQELNQSQHLVGNTSFESICALLCKKQFSPERQTIKLLTIGQRFQQDLTQNNGISATIVTKPDDHLSDSQMHSLYQLLWKSLTQLDLMCQSVICDAKDLNKSEFSRIDLQVWLHSENQWLTAMQISNYREYVSVRLGAPDSHIINADINLLPIVLSIIEQKQTIDADIEIPECLKQF